MSQNQFFFYVLADDAMPWLPSGIPAYIPSEEENKEKDFTPPLLPQERLDEDLAKDLQTRLELVNGVDFADWSCEWFYRDLTRQHKFCARCETSEGRRLACFRVIPVENTAVQYFCRFCAEEVVAERKLSTA